MSNQAVFDYKNQDGSLYIKLSGSFTAPHITEVDAITRTLPVDKIKQCEIDFSGIDRIDTTGAWIIKRLCEKLKVANVKVSLIHVSHHAKDLLNLVTEYYQKEDKIEELNISKFHAWLEDIGKTTIRELQNAGRIVTFLGELVVSFGFCLTHIRRFRIPAIFVLLQRVGLNALPIVGLISFLVGVVLIFQGDYQLRKFGAEIFAIDLLAISMLREIGVLITAIVIAGRSGSAFTAQIGAMKMNQEIDAMRVIGLNPIEVLVIPRTVALLIALPLLVFYTDIMGLLGGAFMARLTMDISFDQFLNQLNLAIGNWTFWVGMIKAPVFAFIIALIGCYEGLQVKDSADSVGSQTTRSVVEAIFLVIIFNAIFSVMFTFMDI